MYGMQFLKSTLVLSLLFTTNIAFAQLDRGRTPRERARNQTHWMQENLALNREQNNKVYEIILYYAKEADKANRNMPRGRGKKMEKQSIRIDREKELREVLSDDQYAKYRAHMQEMKERHRAKMAEQGRNRY